MKAIVILGHALYAVVKIGDFMTTWKRIVILDISEKGDYGS